MGLGGGRYDASGVWVVDEDGKILLSSKIANDEADILTAIAAARSLARKLVCAVDIIGPPAAPLLLAWRRDRDLAAVADRWLGNRTLGRDFLWTQPLTPDSPQSCYAAAASRDDLFGRVFGSAGMAIKAVSVLIGRRTFPRLCSAGRSTEAGRGHIG